LGNHGAVEKIILKWNLWSGFNRLRTWSDDLWAP
jgi:hypothetical protein